MAYLVLARKYRPMTLAELVGQEHIARALSNALAMNRIPHALLFCGARGTGKTSTARIVAKMLNCAQGPTDKPCGICPACTEISASTCVDVQELDAASNRGIDKVRELRNGVGYFPSRDKFKVYIVDEAHMLTDEAANALLKTLEEPPEHVVFILATTDPQRLPVTIRSRCQRYDFKRVKAQDVVNSMAAICAQEGVKADPEGLFLVAREGDGSMRDSLSVLDQVIAFGGERLEADMVAALLGVADRARTHQLLGALVKRDTVQAIEALAAAHDHGLDLRTLARNLAVDARDLLVVRLAGQQARQLVDRSDSEIEALRQLGEPASGGDLERLAHVLLELAEQVSKARHAKLTMELGLVRLCRAPSMVDIGELAARVETLLASGARIGGARGGNPQGSGQQGGAGQGGGGQGSGGQGSAGQGGYGSGGGYGGSRSGGGYSSAPQALGHTGSAGLQTHTGMHGPTGIQGQVSPQAARSPALAPPLRPVEFGARADAPLASGPALGDRDLAPLQKLLDAELQRPAEAQLLAQAVVVANQERSLRLGVPSDFWLSQANPEAVQWIAQALQRSRGGQWQVAFCVDSRARTDSLAAQNQRARQQQRQSTEQQLRSEPLVQTLLATFGGEVTSVLIEGEPQS
jgi:DNA polymerase-3 subunit gamma/tau